MLTPETKRKIDNCRDTLVGKIPVPMSQIEQITLALTYKFMSDIDEENRELGWASFFEWDFEKYAWKTLMDKRNGAQERLNLYSEGLDSMSRNGNIPDLFRDIFRNAYLPFKDPTTLDRFLKQIDEFHYEHSEELGNAFEYLLSTAGSQGDAGQFRTPRHIIDFLVSVVEPTKDDTILDPACGTAGFLISAYKHILEQNGKNLSIEDKQKISKNISGYDISHDMVRLSLVNMYLHNFADPKIYEYDTLSSEERWHDDFDCILANPPFMTPKGGSQPHKRFSITSTKSEVLFVDYIMEHMKIHGKAGIIVPEGVIFQSGKAYKELRENMVKNNFLWAVVSLPGGVFQPYSGVKTSILFFDRQLAKKTDKVLFVKVSTDGYDLGAQRRTISKNDLPEAFEILKKYKEDIEKNNDIEPISSSLAHLVEKAKIAETNDYFLSGDRYRENIGVDQSNFQMIELGEIFEEIKNGKNVDQIDEDWSYRVSRIQTIAKWVVDLSATKWTNDSVNESDFLKENDILMSHINSIDHLWKTAIFQSHEKVVHWANLLRFRNYSLDKILPKFALSVFKSKRFLDEVQKYAQKAVNQASINTTSLRSIQIPLPPLEVQKQIIEEFDWYQRIIDWARAVVESYKPTIKIDPEWEIVRIWDIAKVQGWFAFKSQDMQETTGPQVIKIWNVKELKFDPQNNPSYINEELFIRNSEYQLFIDDILISMTGTAGKRDYWNICMVDIQWKFLLNQRVWRIIPNWGIDKKYLFYILNHPNTKDNFYANAAGWVRQWNISNKQIESIYIPIPSLEIQQSIVERIENERKLVEATKKLIDIYDEKIKQRIGEVWGL